LIGLFQKILVPIDGSKSANNALVNALQLTKIHGSEVEILHVMTFTEYLPSEPERSEKTDSPSAWIEDYMTRIRKKSEKMLSEAIMEA
jgi:nucleotide-binding universal stress UspA family protein